jgi:hypothetical protein
VEKQNISQYTMTSRKTVRYPRNDYGAGTGKCGLGCGEDVRCRDRVKDKLNRGKNNEKYNVKLKPTES